MTLNLKDPKGLEVFKRLVRKADVIVENFRPDVKTKLGIDYEASAISTLELSTAAYPDLDRMVPTTSDQDLIKSRKAWVD